MVLENELPGADMPGGSESTANSIYESLSELAPERDVLIEDEDIVEEGVQHQTLGERMASSPNLSDTQTIVKQMFPPSGFTHLDNVQVSRIFPDIYNPMSRALVKDLLQKSDDELSVAEAMAIVNNCMSTGIDGEGRIELVALAGAAKEAATEKEKSKLGL